MRLLFTFIGGHGHFIPLVPIARAAQAVGHTVAFGCGPSMAQTVTAAGFTTFTLGSDSTGTPQRLPLRPLDAAREDEEFRERFARDGAQYRAPLMLELIASWKPNVLVCDETDFGAMVAAERLGVPHVIVFVMAAGSFVRKEIVGEALNELRALQDLPPDPELEMLRRGLVLAPFPPSFRDPAFPLPITGQAFCPEVPKSPRAVMPPWPITRPDWPTVYFTLGTVFNIESGDLFSRVLTSLRALPANLIVTVGPHIDPTEFGPQPENVFITDYLAQEKILPHCDLVVSHGGSGSVGGVLAHGLPSVLIPLGADQPLNATRCVQLGLGQMLDPITLTPESVRAAVMEVLATPHYQQNAHRLRDEFVALPGPADAIKLIAHLSERR